MGFIDFLSLVVFFAHFALFRGQYSHFKLFDYFEGAPWWFPKVLNTLRYPHHSCNIPAAPKNMNKVKNKAPIDLMVVFF